MNELLPYQVEEIIKNVCNLLWISNSIKKTLWPLFIDGVQLPLDYSYFEEAVYFLPFSSQKFLVLIVSTSEGLNAESTLEPPSEFEHGTPRWEIQHL